MGVEGRDVDDTRPLINLLGTTVALGPVDADHAATLARWYSDYGMLRNLGALPGPYPMERIRGLFTSDGLLGDPANAAFAVYETGSWELIGVAGLLHVDHVDRGAELFVVIGEARHRGKGYGTEATRLVLDHAFLALGLVNVLLRVVATNLAGIRAYEKAGFRRIGVRRRSKLMGGRLWDTVYMEALAEEFESPVLGRVLLPDEPEGESPPG